MCGIAGIMTVRSGPALEDQVRRMAGTLAHRGPDDDGIWVDQAAGAALGFRRLAIIDLSPLGHQPMKSASGRFVMVFNGEVYNFLPLRRELEGMGARFRGNSDSEVILAAFERWGVERAVRRFIGMFAIAAWDTAERTLTLVRDRLGIKPLFIHARGGLVLFGSELKAVAAHPQFRDEVDPAAVAAYLRYLYVPAPATIYRQTVKLLPGHILTISDPKAPLPPSVPYWSALEVAGNGLDRPFTGTESDAIDELDTLLCDAVRLRLQADVPLGALLSGGVDSSTVVALMQEQAGRRVRTFTIGFDAREYDEAAQARRVAAHLGTDHTELYLNGDDALELVPQLPQMFDEPLADPSQLPTYLVCRLARRHVTVALSGDGGDELFAGYNRYLEGERMIAGPGGWPRLLRRVGAAALTAVPAGGWDAIHRALLPLLPARARGRLPGDKLHKLAALLREDSPDRMYRSLLSAWQDPSSLVVGGKENGRDVLAAVPGLGLLESMMLADQTGYLADDLLAKVDRASMAVSLETRVPLLDHRVVELSWRLPRQWKTREGRGKWLLRQVLYRRVPRQLVDREKMGFSVPIAAWLQGPLRTWAADLLASPGCEPLNLAAAQRAWTRFVRGERGLAAGLWAVLNYVAWHREHIRGGTPVPLH